MASWAIIDLTFVDLFSEFKDVHKEFGLQLCYTIMIHSKVHPLQKCLGVVCRVSVKKEREARSRFILHPRPVHAVKKNAYSNKHGSDYGIFENIAFVESLLHTHLVPLAALSFIYWKMPSSRRRSSRCAIFVRIPMASPRLVSAVLPPALLDAGLSSISMSMEQRGAAVCITNCRSDSRRF